MNVSPAAQIVPTKLANRVDVDAMRQLETAQIGGGGAGVKVETLDNGARVVIAERPGAAETKVQVGFAAGSLQDESGKLGTAHFLEHMLFEGVPGATGDQQELQRQKLGGMWNAYTTTDRTVYFGITEKNKASEGAKLLGTMITSPVLDSKYIKQERAAVTNEMIYRGSEVADEAWHINQRLIFGDQPLTNNVIGTKDTVGAIDGKTLRSYHDRYYTGRNAVVLVEGDPKSLPLDEIRKSIGALPAGGKIDNSGLGRGFAKGQAVQAVNDRGAGAVDLAISIPIDAENIEQGAANDLLVSLVSGEMNDRLRRNKNLTYGAQASLGPADAAKGAVLTVETTVAKENAEAAVTAIVKILQDGKDGYGPKHFADAKEQAIARMKMISSDTGANEGQLVSDHAEEVFDGMLTSTGTDIPPQISGAKLQFMKSLLTAELEAVTEDDVKAAGNAMINLDNLKVLAVGAVGKGDAIMAGLEAAGLDTSKMDRNPVDLSYYKKMGLGR